MHKATTKLIDRNGWLFSRDIGFTLIEVVAGIAILVIMLGTFIVAFQKTVDSAATETLRERATAVAQRHMELLLANPQEPNSVGLPNVDEIDPLFVWQMNLRRIPIGNQGTRQNLSNTVIEATLSAQCALEGIRSGEPAKLTRYFATMKPKPGNTIAVPLSPDDPEDLWYIELKQKLGREPTLDEMLERMRNQNKLPFDGGDGFEVPEDDGEYPSEEEIEKLEQEIKERKEAEAEN